MERERMENKAASADHFRTILRSPTKTALALFILNEIRGAVMAGPILLAMAAKGPTWLLAWTLFCIAASVLVPVYLWRKVNAEN
jgi:hypothetical protein